MRVINISFLFINNLLETKIVELLKLNSKLKSFIVILNKNTNVIYFWFYLREYELKEFIIIT